MNPPQLVPNPHRIRLDESRPPALHLDELPVPVAKTLRSLGYEVMRLRMAGRTLQARVKNETLPASLAPLTRTLTLPVLAVEDALSLEVSLEAGRVRLSSSPQPFLPVPLLALFHLPALRGFWIRELRRSHFDRLRRVLPKAWFVTEDPPVGAVIPDLGVTSWRDADDARSLSRDAVDGVEVAVESSPPAAAPVALSYRRIVAA